MLWKYGLNYSGFIDAPASVSDARKVLIDDLRAHPEKYITRLEPAEPTTTSLVELGKRVIGMK